jgi:2,4-dichlorophenol 6-monooxygenase
VPQGPTRWGAHSEEWLLVVSRPDVDASQPEKMVEWGSKALGIPDWAPEVHGVSEWWLETVLADDFRAGRVFLLGDAAHRLPPSGGLGLNSAVQDAYNLCWKIAAVLDGRAGDALLDTYTTERRSVNRANIDTAINAVVGQDMMTPSLGISSAKSVAENWEALGAFWEDRPGAVERRHEFTTWLSHRSLEFRQHNIDFGYTYEDGAIVVDGSPKPVPLDAVRLYEPSTRPGAPLPHAWVTRAAERLPLRTLAHDGHFALITGEGGQAWVDAATKVAGQLNVPLRTARVGLGDVDLVDVRLTWKKNREISPEGAVLVRPDGFIAFRSIGAVDDPAAVLSSAFGQILNIAIS